MNHVAPRACIRADYGNPFKVPVKKEFRMDDVIKKITDPYLLFQIEPFTKSLFGFTQSNEDTMKQLFERIKKLK